MARPSVHGPKKLPLSVAGWVAIAAMGVILGASIWFMFYGWNLTDAQIDTNGYIALGLGVFFSMIVGGGLMTLLFWSNRKGYDR
jgi:TRAP-type C4-dicarboxylate transport system permease small subunit